MKYNTPNTRPVPIIITLAAAGISCVINILKGATFSEFVWRLVATVVIFGLLGCFVRVFLDMGFKIDRKEEEAKEQEEEEASSDEEGTDETPDDTEPDKGKE